METSDQEEDLGPCTAAYSRSPVPLFGGLIDYVETSLDYLKGNAFFKADKLHFKHCNCTLSATFLTVVCLILGLAANVKFEVVLFDDMQLTNDLHFVLMSEEDKLYVDDIDVSRVMWCIEASDCLVVSISCLMIWCSNKVSFPLSEYLFLPWLGVTLRGLLMRQVPTACALVYTIAVVDGTTNPIFLTAFFFLFLLEGRMWLEISRLVYCRWRGHEIDANINKGETLTKVETLWGSENAPSVEVRNYLY